MLKKWITSQWRRMNQSVAPYKKKYDLVSSRGFWDYLPDQFLCLAPMADVTDVAFRRMFARYGKPDITWTEFVSADGLLLRPSSPNATTETEHEKIAGEYGISSDHPLLRDLLYDEGERPIVAQFFSRDIERMEKVASLAHDLGYDGIDINMGCPAKVICKQGAGAAMIKDPEHAQKIIQAAICGSKGIPVSVKTRVGFNRDELDTWLPALIHANPVAISLHARTRKDMSKVPSDWDYLKRAVAIRDNINPNVKIIGNGDIRSRQEAYDRMNETGCDGAMIGRGIFGNPWFFNPEISKEDLAPKVILDALIEHTALFEKYLGDVKSFYIMKKHFKAYVSGWDGAKELRTRLIQETESLDQVKEIIDSYLGR